MKSFSILVFFGLATFVQCRDEVSDTFFYIQNDLDSPMELQLKRDGYFLFTLPPKKDTLICEAQKMGKEDFADFVWIFNCYDSIKVFDDNGVLSKKELTSPSEWSYVQRNATEAEYRLIIDSTDF